jgi:hypothetical protein
MNPAEEPPPEAVAQFVHSLAAHLVQQASAELEKVLLTAEVDSRPQPHPLPVEYVCPAPRGSLLASLAWLTTPQGWHSRRHPSVNVPESACSSSHESSLRVRDLGGVFSERWTLSDVSRGGATNFLSIMELHAAQPFLANWILQNPSAGLPTLSRAIQLAQERILAGHPNMADMTVKRLVHPRVDLHRLSYPGAINSLLLHPALLRPTA